MASGRAIRYSKIVHSGSDRKFISFGRTTAFMCSNDFLKNNLGLFKIFSATAFAVKAATWPTADPVGTA
jgi:hypothetical protein